MPDAMRTLCLALVALLGAVSSARALPEFPDDLQDETGAPCPPHCTLCHADEGPSEENLTRPFGELFEKSGGGENLARAIERIRKAGTDSDGDGVGDIDELAAGQDPNNSYDTSLCGPEVGCTVATDTATPASALALLVALSALARRRRA